jgi:hypothetical protein
VSLLTVTKSPASKSRASLPQYSCSFHLQFKIGTIQASVCLKVPDRFTFNSRSIPPALLIDASDPSILPVTSSGLPRNSHYTTSYLDLPILRSGILECFSLGFCMRERNAVCRDGVLRKDEIAEKGRVTAWMQCSSIFAGLAEEAEM